MYPEFIGIFVGLGVLVCIMIIILILLIIILKDVKSPKITPDYTNIKVESLKTNVPNNVGIVYCKNCMNPYAADKNVCPNCQTPR